MNYTSERIYTVFFLPDGILDFDNIVIWGSHTTLRDAITVASVELRHEIKRINHVWVMYRADGTPAICILKNYVHRYETDKNDPHSNAAEALERALQWEMEEEEEKKKRWSKHD